MKHRISFEILGEKFLPQNINFEFTESTIPGEVLNSGRFKGQESPYGSASFIVPNEVMSMNPFKFLADTFEPLLDDLIRNGAEQWHIDVGRLYFAQCNEELSFKELKEIVRLKCSVSYSAYAVSEKEEDEGWS